MGPRHGPAGPQRDCLAEPREQRDLRAAEGRWLRGGIRAKTGLLLDPYFSGTKIRYLLDKIPDLRARAERGEVLFGTVDSFLIWRLTNGAVPRHRRQQCQPHTAAQHPHTGLG